MQPPQFPSDPNQSAPPPFGVTPAPFGTPPPPQQYNPYAAPQAPLDYGQNVHLELAERGTRLGGAILDALVYVASMVPGGILLAVAGNKSGAMQTMGFILLAVGVIAAMVVNAMWLHQTGQSVAKRILGIKILRADGSRCSFPRIFFIRYLVPGIISNIPILGGFFGLANPLFIFRADYRCIHDLMADTIVVKA
jgi:uncharacterized RDD family membrane protein YckC